jgi:hypothetical protein
MRWYDEFDALASCLEGLRALSRRERARVVGGALEVISAVRPGFLDEHVASFPLHRRRWYDDDSAETWMLFHALERADATLREAVTAHLFEQMVVAA